MKLSFKICLILLLGVLVARLSHANPAGEKVFKASKCQDCHYTKGPAKEKTIDDQLAKKGTGTLVCWQQVSKSLAAEGG